MVAFSILVLCVCLRILFHEGELRQYENHQVLKYYYQYLKYHSEGLAFHWYGVNSECMYV